MNRAIGSLSAKTDTVKPAGTVNRCPSGIATTWVGLRYQGVAKGAGSGGVV